MFAKSQILFLLGTHFSVSVTKENEVDHMSCGFQVLDLWFRDRALNGNLLIICGH